VAEVAALAHEATVIERGAGSGGRRDGQDLEQLGDPVADMDDAILEVIKAAKYGSLMGVGVLFGATAWKMFKNQDKVRGRFVVGNGTGRPRVTWGWRCRRSRARARCSSGRRR
jgi:hypothetical protein